MMKYLPMWNTNFKYILNLGKWNVYEELILKLSIYKYDNIDFQSQVYASPEAKTQQCDEIISW